MRRTRNPVHGFSRDVGSNPTLSASSPMKQDGNLLLPHIEPNKSKSHLRDQTFCVALPAYLRRDPAATCRCSRTYALFLIGEVKGLPAIVLALILVVRREGKQRHLSCRRHECVRRTGRRSFGACRKITLRSLPGNVSRTHPNVPASRIATAASRTAAKASRDSAPPTLMRLTPASASCCAVISGSAELITTFTGFCTAATTRRMVSRSRKPGA